MPTKSIKSKKRDARLFAYIAEKASHFTGSSTVFGCALVFIIIWAVMGPLYHYSDGWQIFINTLTNIVTFLLVFVIQNSQNREIRAVQLKLDELIRANQNAQNTMLTIEKLTDDELHILRDQYEKLANKARNNSKDNTLKD